MLVWYFVCGAFFAVFILLLRARFSPQPSFSDTLIAVPVITIFWPPLLVYFLWRVWIALRKVL